jgi:hypothetical protein
VHQAGKYLFTWEKTPFFQNVKPVVSRRELRESTGYGITGNLLPGYDADIKSYLR